MSTQLHSPKIRLRSSAPKLLVSPAKEGLL